VEPPDEELLDVSLVPDAAGLSFVVLLSLLEPSLLEPSLFEPSLFEPSLFEPSLFEPTLLASLALSLFFGALP
jgi:hypothetical protein